jgi:uncharacterized DUF497 family protein
MCTAMSHHSFEWDESKAKANLRRHAVSFAQAMRVLGDPSWRLFHVERFDEAHSQGEDRYITIASDPYARDVVLVIVWTDRDAVTRIISARAATGAERNDYESEIQGRQNHP